MCDGRQFASPLSRRLAGGGPIFRGSTICALFGSLPDLTGCSTLLQERSPVRMRSPTRHFIVPFPHCPMVSAKSTNIDAGTANHRYRFDLLQDVADQVRHMLTSGTPAGSDQSCLSSSHEDPNDEHPEDALPTLPHLRWRRDALQPPQIQRGSPDRNTCVHIPDGGLRCVTWSTRGLIGSLVSSQLSTEQKHGYLRRLIENNNIICLQEVHGKDEFLQAIQVLAPRFRLYGPFIPSDANAGRSALCIHKDLLPDDAVVTHVVACQGRDHILNVRSGCLSPVVVNLHFEPDITLKRIKLSAMVRWESCSVSFFISSSSRNCPT